MGRGDPLDHPDLREIERCLDALELDEAQRRLARIGDAPQLTDAAAYLATRLLFLRGRIDAEGVAERLREVIRRVGYFPRAAAMLHEAETGHLHRPGSSAPSIRPLAPRATMPLSDVPITARNANWSSQEASDDPGEPPSQKMVTRGQTARVADELPSEPEIELEPAWDSAPLEAPASQPETHGRPERKRTYTPIKGFKALSAPKAQRTAGPLVDPTQPAIPRAPAVPEFEPNKAPPSYEPEAIPQFDTLGQKNFLPARAGRYSGAPESSAEEEPGLVKRPSRRTGASTVPPKPSSKPPIRSGLPDEGRLDAPSLLEIAAWIDEGHFVKAIAAVNRVGPAATADFILLRARALAGAGYEEQAHEALQKLEATPTLDPELRAGCARLYVELGDPSRGLRQAIRALDEEPERSLIRLTFALCAVRCSRRRPDRTLLEQADRMLETLGSRGGPHPALSLALEACVQVELDDPEHALATAQRALGIDANTIDALAAVASAASLLGRTNDARHAYRRLCELAPEEAAAIKAGIGEAAVEPGPEEPASDELRMPSGVWPSAEIALVSGDRQMAMEVIEELASDHLKRMSKTGPQSGLTAIATIASTFLTTAPVFRSFAPYDVSLHSIHRIEAALNVLYGAVRRPRLRTDEAPMILLLGAYLGETLRLAYEGRWEGKITQLDAARVIGANKEWKPFLVVAARLQQGRRAALSEAFASALASRGGPAWSSNISNPVAAPSPWDPRTWPRPSEMELLGRALGRSAVSQYCEQYAHGPLDRSIPSLGAIDAYLDLIAPFDSSNEVDTAWTRRTAVLVGAYVGEVLRTAAGGQWLSSVDYAVRADDYRVLLHHRIEATPVVAVLRRITGESTDRILQYAKSIVREANLD